MRAKFYSCELGVLSFCIGAHSTSDDYSLRINFDFSSPVDPTFAVATRIFEHQVFGVWVVGCLLFSVGSGKLRKVVGQHGS